MRHFTKGLSLALLLATGAAFAQDVTHVAPSIPEKFEEKAVIVPGFVKPDLRSDAIFGASVQPGYKAPSHNNYGDRDIPGLDAIRADKVNSFIKTVDPTDSIEIRLQAVRDTAKSFGARFGLYARTNQINNFLLGAQGRKIIDKTFNFQNLMVEANINSQDGISRVVMVMPPIIIEGRNTVEVSKADTLRRVDHSLKIKRQARFVTVVPVWENYLVFHATRPKTEIHEALVPKNDLEKAAWDKGVQSGWDAGIRQADSIYDENLACLREDFEGMQRYQFLLVQNLVSLPFVASVNLGVTGDRSKLNINDEVMTITAMPELNLDMDSWKVLPSW